uniref:Putative secreted protein n=1 Tax=Ixodes ricinus TaxID=34613 RepID=A0A6B0TWF9_IXORI
MNVLPHLFFLALSSSSSYSISHREIKPRFFFSSSPSSDKGVPSDTLAEECPCSLTTLPNCNLTSLCF